MRGCIIFLLLACQGASFRNSERKGNVGSLTFSGTIVPISEMTMEVTTVDEELGAYRVAMTYNSTGVFATNEQAEYLVFAGQELDAPPQYFAGVGNVSLALAPDTQMYILDGEDDEAIANWVELVRGEEAYAERSR